MNVHNKDCSQPTFGTSALEPISGLLDLTELDQSFSQVAQLIFFTKNAISASYCLKIRFQILNRK